MAWKTLKNPEGLWKEFKKTGSEDSRNRLVEIYFPLVRYLAERLLSKLPQSVELDDLTSAGVFGLMDAIDGYDLNRGVKFETYCTTRIRGAILDGLRAMDWVPRLVRSKAHRLEAAKKRLEMELGRSPSAREMSERLGIDVDEYDDLVREASAVTIVSLGESADDGDESRVLRTIDHIEDKQAIDPIHEIAKKEVMDLVMKILNRRERIILILYYYEELTMREIGASLGLSESRVCQLHSRIIERLRTHLQRLRQDLVA
ncbi:MAG: FliA/WhiG family RNA polymerase sigma factor [Planctomycetota bacterium]|nr:FliA/WhiG family RNA polymerase sigma factor [Planctomycetota bacterium]